MSDLVDPSPNASPQTPSHQGWNLPAWSIQHPYLIITFFLAGILASVLAVSQVIPRRMMPYLESPM
ncbi:MAG: hypothetical protein AB7I41_22600, partial [Candidatus Sericytochromatia bacterium]